MYLSFVIRADLFYVKQCRIPERGAIERERASEGEREEESGRERGHLCAKVAYR